MQCDKCVKDADATFTWTTKLRTWTVNVCLRHGFDFAMIFLRQRIRYSCVLVIPTLRYADAAPPFPTRAAVAK